MSNYSLVILNQAYIAETIQRTGSEQLLDKATRSFVGFYDAETNWYIPLRANISRKKPKAACYRTPFKTHNPHFVNPGLDFEKSLFVPTDSIIEIRNTLPHDQAQFIETHLDDIRQKFEKYVLSVDHLDHNSPSYLYSTIALFPEGVEHLKRVIAKRQAQRKRVESLKSKHMSLEKDVACLSKQKSDLQQKLQAAITAANKQETVNPQKTPPAIGAKYLYSHFVLAPDYEVRDKVNSLITYLVVGYNDVTREVLYYGIDSNQVCSSATWLTTSYDTLQDVKYLNKTGHDELVRYLSSISSMIDTQIKENEPIPAYAKLYAMLQPRPPYITSKQLSQVRALTHTPSLADELAAAKQAANRQHQQSAQKQQSHNLKL